MARAGPDHRWVMLLVGLTQLIVTTDFSIVSVALPSIGRQPSVPPPSLRGIASAVLFTAQQIGVPLGATVALSVLGSSGGGGFAIATFRDGYLAMLGMVGLGLAASLLVLRRTPSMTLQSLATS